MENTNKRYYKELDGLKGIAAIVIAYFYHYCNEFNGAQPMIDLPVVRSVMTILYEYGYLLVDIFFCISGFILFKGYYTKIQMGYVSAGEFVRKRVLRLFPLLWMTTIAAWIFQWFNIITTGESYMNTGNDVFYLLLALAGLQSGWISGGNTFNSPAWFISVILVCYILFFITAKKAKDKAPLWWVGLLILGIYIVRVEPFDNKVPLMWDTMGRGYMSFFLGTLMGYGATRYAGNKQIKRWGIWTALMGIFVWGVGYVFDLLGSKLLTFALILSPATIYLCMNITLVRKILSMKLFQLLGKISFSIYLWNFPTDMLFDIINRYTNWFDYQSWWFYLLHLVVSLVIAIVSYCLLEPWAEKKLVNTLAVLDTKAGKV